MFYVVVNINVTCVPYVVFPTISIKNSVLLFVQKVSGLNLHLPLTCLRAVFVILPLLHWELGEAGRYASTLFRVSSSV